jgi:hypothetical protein
MDRSTITRVFSALRQTDFVTLMKVPVPKQGILELLGIFRLHKE